MHLSDYYPSPAIGVQFCGQCKTPDYQAMPPLKYCSGCKWTWYCSVKCSKKDWKNHKELCKIKAEQHSQAEKAALIRPRETLLLKKLDEFLDRAGASEVTLATELGFHMSHPSAPRIDTTHYLRLTVEVDPEAGTKPLRDQFTFISYELVPKGNLVASGRTLMADNANGQFDSEQLVVLEGYWKGDRTALKAISGRGAWNKRVEAGTEREYEAIVKDWFPFIQKALKEPPLDLRHLFDRKVDLATRTFDFRGLGDDQLPPKTSPGYAAAREAMFKKAEVKRDATRQFHSVKSDGGGPIIAQFTNDGVTQASVAIVSDGGQVRMIPVAEGKDVFEQEKKDVKKQKKDARKRAKQATKAEDLSVDELDLD